MNMFINGIPNILSKEEILDKVPRTQLVHDDSGTLCWEHDVRAVFSNDPYITEVRLKTYGLNEDVAKTVREQLDELFFKDRVLLRSTPTYIIETVTKSTALPSGDHVHTVKHTVIYV